jgi:hypothetical protein
MSIIKSKRRRPESLGYNSWAPIIVESPGNLTGVTNSSVIQIESIPLGLNYKVTHISYVLTNGLTSTGDLKINIVSGAGSYEGLAAVSPSARLTLGGTFVPGDKIVVTIGGAQISHTFTTRTAPNLTLMAASLANSLNYDPLFNTTYIANSLGPVVVYQQIAYTTATPTFAASTNSVAGTVTVSSATLVGGVAGTNPTQPILDQTQIGIVPSGTVVTGDALFPADIVLATTVGIPQNQVGLIYAVKNFDAIWPAGSLMTLRAEGIAPPAGTIHVIVWGVPVDLHIGMPAEANQGFRISQFVL